MDGGWVYVFFQGSIGAACTVRSFRDHKDSENKENKNRDQDKIPAPEFCGSARSRRSEAPVRGTINASVNSEFRFVRHELHKPSSIAMTQTSIPERLLLKTYRITIWLQAANTRSRCGMIQRMVASGSAVYQRLSKKLEAKAGSWFTILRCGAPLAEPRLLPLEAPWTPHF